MCLGLPNLTATRAFEQFHDLLVRNLLEVLVPIADGQELEGCLAAFSRVRVLG
jgi:hypothetical protein